MTIPKKKLNKPRSKLLLVLVLLIFSAAILSFASYAWIVLSVRPSVEGISTNIGANGALEMALLTDETYENTELIQSRVGDSISAQDKVTANTTWGNLIDLSDELYGLDKISLKPSALSIKHRDDVVQLNEGYLLFPTFGADGRVSGFIDSSMTGKFYSGSFLGNGSRQQHGVTAIGVSEESSPQQIALMHAATAIPTDRTQAQQKASKALSSNGSVLFKSHSDDAYFDSDVQRLVDLADDTAESLSFIDDAIRQALLAMLSSEINNQSIFETVRDMVTDTAVPLSSILDTLPVTVPETIRALTGELNEAQQSVQSARDACAQLSGDSYSGDQIQPIIDLFLDKSKVYYNGELLGADKSIDELKPGSVISVLPESGPYSIIADFCGEYFGYIDGAEIKLRTAMGISRLIILSGVVSELSPAESDGTALFELSDIYGYMIDLAFRSNAVSSELLLQTEETQRVYEAALNDSTLGAGSNMVFYSSQLDSDRLIQLMDAVRVSFIDSRGRLLALAKLNTSNYEPWNEGYRAPLYLYDYSAFAGNLIIGERRGANSAVMELPQNIPVIVSAIVWLDGNYVENSLAATFGSTVTASLNLQFSSSAGLRPVGSEYAESGNEYYVPSENPVIERRADIGTIEGAENITVITVFENEAEALQSGYTLPETYISLRRDDLPYARAYLTGEATEIVLTGYDEGGILLPADSSELFAGLKSLQTIGNMGKLNGIRVSDSSGMFSDCFMLEHAAIADGLTYIGDSAFDNCISLLDVTIPDSVKSIADYAFDGCNSITDVYYEGSSEKWSKVVIGAGNESLMRATIHFAEN